MPKVEKEVKTIVFNGKNLKELLQRVGLRGAIEECVLEIIDGIGSVQALDNSHVVLVNAQQELSPNKETFTLGLGKLALLSGFLEGEDGIHAEIEEQKGEGTWLTLIKPNNGKIRVLLLAKGTIPTKPNGDMEEIKKNVLKTSTIHLNLEKDKVEELIKYVGLIGCPSVFFNFNDETGELTVNNNPDSEQQFSFVMAKTEQIVGSSVKVEVYSQFLLLVLKTLVFAENEQPKISLGNKAPVIIHQNENNWWALTPTVE